MSSFEEFEELSSVFNTYADSQWQVPVPKSSYPDMILCSVHGISNISQ